MSDHARAADVTFSAEEGRCLDVLAALLGRARGDLVTVPARFEAPRTALLEAGRTRIARAVVAWLAREGGYRERQLLRGGARVTGRVWDTRLGQGFAPRFTAASRGLWLSAAARLPSLAAIDTSARPSERALGELVPVRATASGDWVFYAIAHTALRSFRLPATEEQTLQRRLRQASPLAALLWPDAGAADDELRAGFAALLRDENVRVVECGDARLTTAWLAAGRSNGGWRIAAEELTRRWTGLGRVLHAWLDALDAARRMDLAPPLLRFSAKLATEVFGGDGEALRRELASAPGLRNIQEREALLATVARVADVATRLLRMREVLAAERYGDDRYEESQVYVRACDRELAPARRQAEGAARALSGIVG